jgi:hypothetical protein
MKTVDLICIKDIDGPKTPKVAMTGALQYIECTQSYQ